MALRQLIIGKKLEALREKLAGVNRRGEEIAARREAMKKREEELAAAIDEVGEVKIDQVVIGSCTNGFYKDIEEAASIIRGKKVAKNVRAIIIPATQSIYLKAMENGLLKDFIEAGCVVSTPTCGPCLGGHMGILAHGEKAVSTTNRNFVGRMGHITSEIYLASPAVAAASAVAGYICAPDDLK